MCGYNKAIYIVAKPQINFLDILMSKKPRNPQKRDILPGHGDLKLRETWKLSNIVTLLISGEISRLRLGKNSVLPFSQAELAAALHVSIPTIREALKQLEASKVIEVKQGKHTIIRNTKKLNGRQHSPEVFLKMRELAETQLTILAARSHRHLATIKKALDELLDSITQLDHVAPEHFEEAVVQLFVRDIAFHTQVELAGNDRWMSMVAEIAEIKTESIRLDAWRSRKYRHDIYNVHKRIFFAIASGQAKACANAVRDHFAIVRRAARSPSA